MFFFHSTFELFCDFVKFRTNTENQPKAEEAINEAYRLCDELRDDGLRAETKMTEGLFRSADWGKVSMKRLELLLEARKLCLKEYGEFSTLMARIYYNVAIFFELQQEYSKAYECFRRTWLIDRQILGAHHPATKKTGSVLTDDYLVEAQRLTDTLPGGDEQGPTERDRNYSERISFLDQILASQKDSTSSNKAVNK